MSNDHNTLGTYVGFVQHIGIRFVCNWAGRAGL